MKPRHYIVLTIGMLTIATAVYILFGYAFGRPSFYTWNPASAMALPTALLFLIVGTALVLLAWPSDIQRRSFYLKFLDQLYTQRMQETDMLRADILGTKRLESLKDQKLRVLLVEDDPNDVMLTLRFIGELFIVDHAATLAEAISMTKAVAYDCVMIDLGLADALPSNAIAKFIKEVPSAVCVAMSGADTYADSAVSQGANAFVRKDRINRDYLWDAINNAVIRKRSRE